MTFANVTSKLIRMPANCILMPVIAMHESSEHDSYIVPCMYSHVNTCGICGKLTGNNVLAILMIAGIFCSSCSATSLVLLESSLTSFIDIMSCRAMMVQMADVQSSLVTFLLVVR